MKQVSRYAAIRCLCSMSCFSLLLLAGCGKSAKSSRASDEEAIRATDARWSAAAEANDLDGTMSYYTDDALLLAPNEPLHTDKPSRKQSWAGLLTPSQRVSWKVSKVAMAEAGDIGYSTGSYVLENRIAPAKPPLDAGKFLEVWRRQADGSWKCVVDAFNSDLPLATAPPTT
jgi:ketosteroid isomerase-like protein